MGAAISITTSLNIPSEIAGVVAVDGGTAFLGAAGVNYRGNILIDAEINPGDWLETSILSVLGKTTPMARRKQMAFDCSRCSPYVQYSDLITYRGFQQNARRGAEKIPGNSGRLDAVAQHRRQPGDGEVNGADRAFLFGLAGQVVFKGGCSDTFQTSITTDTVARFAIEDLLRRLGKPFLVEANAETEVPSSLLDAAICKTLTGVERRESP